MTNKERQTMKKEYVSPDMSLLACDNEELLTTSLNVYSNEEVNSGDILSREGDVDDDEY
jgi:hypothetical protein